jgi:cytochrome c-type biogenesis protein CcmH/NrfG
VPDQQPTGLPPRIYLPIVSVFALVFLGMMAYLIAQGFGVTGSVLGAGGKPVAGASQQTGATNIEGGPPAAVMTQLRTLRTRIAAHPNDDVALTQLADMYLTANKFSEAIPLYRRALAANPSNVAARAGLDEATSGLAQSQGK